MKKTFLVITDNKFVLDTLDDVERDVRAFAPGEADALRAFGDAAGIGEAIDFPALRLLVVRLASPEVPSFVAGMAS